MTKPSKALLPSIKACEGYLPKSRMNFTQEFWRSSEHRGLNYNGIFIQEISFLEVFFKSINGNVKNMPECWCLVLLLGVLVLGVLVLGVLVLGVLVLGVLVLGVLLLGVAHTFYYTSFLRQFLRKLHHFFGKIIFLMPLTKLTPI